MPADPLSSSHSPVALARHLIEFDPRAAAHYRFAAGPESAAAQSLAASFHADPIPWPRGLAPTPVHPDPLPADTDPLPTADALVVTYTVAEAYAAADVLTPGLPTSGWTDYRHNWAEIKKTVKQGAPSLHDDRAARWTQTRIGPSTAVVVKSELHPATDGVRLPLRTLWRQMIDEVRPRLVITTGTAGGVGADVLLGDVIVSQHVRWDATRTFADEPFAHAAFTSHGALGTSRFAEATQTLIPVNAAHLPPAPRHPKIWTNGSTPLSVLTTDFFAFDDADDHYGLRSYEPDAKAVEMDDAALALAAGDLSAPPTWVSVRNASDPQMNGASLDEETKQAAAIYEKYGYWTTVGSAITCWALIASLEGLSPG